MGVKLQNITKSFGNTKACDGISLELEAGKIHSILGENGAGKSTLMKIIIGLVQPDTGEIKIDGKSYEYLTPSLAEELNISMVHQGFSLVEEMSILENLQLAQKSSRHSAFTPLKKSLVGSLNVFMGEFSNLNPNTGVKDLNMGQRQQLEILKALNPSTGILILDEPTSFLDYEQAAELKVALRNLAEQGCAVAFISHDLDEVLDISDSISVLENGRIIEQVEQAQIGGQAADLNYGKANIRQNLPSSISGMDNPLLDIKELVLNMDKTSLDKSEPLNLSVHPSEIVALTGRGIGSIASNSIALMEVFLGIKKPISGNIYAGKELLKTNVPGAVKDARISVIPKNREQSASILEMTVLENLFLLEPINKRGFLSKDEMYLKAIELLEEYNIVPANPHMKMAELSGGNQQRVILARELSSEPKVLIAEGLIEGLDIAAVDEIFWNIQRAAARGIGILLLTNDSNLLKLTHRKLNWQN